MCASTATIKNAESKMEARAPNKITVLNFMSKRGAFDLTKP